MKRTCRYLLVLFLAVFWIAESSPLPQAESWSDWVLASSAPVGAKIREWRWVYNRTTWQDSTNTSLEGFAYDGDEWIQSGTGQVNYASFPDGFNTEHWIYTSIAKEPYSAYENATNRRKVENNWAGFVYWHWMYRIAGANAYDTENFGLQRTYTNKGGEWIPDCGYATEFHASVRALPLLASLRDNILPAVGTEKFPHWKTAVFLMPEKVDPAFFGAKARSSVERHTFEPTLCHDVLSAVGTVKFHNRYIVKPFHSIAFIYSVILTCKSL